MNIQYLFLIVVFQISLAYGLERLCGRTLADVLDLICQGRGFHGESSLLEPQKRSFKNQMITRRQATTFLVGSTVPPSLSTGRHGVVEECCVRHCTYETLESYCARPSSSEAIDLEEFLNPSSSSTSSTTSTARYRTTTAGPPTTKQFRRLPNFLKGRTFFFIRNQPQQQEKKKRSQVKDLLKRAIKTNKNEDKKLTN